MRVTEQAPAGTAAGGSGAADGRVAGDRLAVRIRLAVGALALDAALDVPAAGVTAVVGPSGCGKTTLLRCIAGLQRAAGTVSLGRAVWQDDAAGIFVPVHRRGVGVVFQEVRLFGHMDVRRNLAYAHRRAPGPPDPARWDAVVAALGVEPLLARRTAALSGGEAQRVALARAVLSRPQLLLLDEPLAALDVQRRRELAPFIARVSRDSAVPMIYVSHALEEVLQVADTVAVMDAGRLIAAGPPGEICARAPLARYLGDELGGVLEGRAAAYDSHYGLVEVQLRDQRLLVPGDAAMVGRRVRVHIRSRDITLATTSPDGATSALNVLRAVVTGVHDADAPYAVLVGLDAGAPLAARITRKSLEHLGLSPGREVYAYIKAVVLAG